MRAVMSAHSGSSIALWSAKGTFSRIFLVQSLSNDAQPPSLHWKVIIHFRPRWKHSSRFCGLSVGILRSASSTIAVSSTSGFHLLLNSKTQPLGSTLAGFLYFQSPRKRISFSISHSAAAFIIADDFRKCPDSCRQIKTMAVSQTGEKQGSMRTVSSVSCSSFLQLMRGADDLRMVVGITQRLERDERIEHRRENRGQAVGPFESFEHPVLGHFSRPVCGTDGCCARANHSASLCRRSSHRKKLRTVNLFRVGREREVAFVDAFGIQLVEVDRSSAGGSV